MSPEWLPIDTAPRDRDVLVYGEWVGEIGGMSGRRRPAAMTTACWTDRTDYPGFDWQAVCTDYASVWVKATHWMPPPEAPA